MGAWYGFRFRWASLALSTSAPSWKSSKLMTRVWKLRGSRASICFWLIAPESRPSSSEGSISGVRFANSLPLPLAAFALAACSVAALAAAAASSLTLSGRSAPARSTRVKLVRVKSRVASSSCMRVRMSAA